NINACSGCGRGNRTAFPTRRSSDLDTALAADAFRDAGCRHARHQRDEGGVALRDQWGDPDERLWFDCQQHVLRAVKAVIVDEGRSEEHTSELQSRENLVCSLLIEKK